MSSERVEFGAVEGDLSNQHVFVIGGGPSLTGFDFSRLKGYKIGANRSALVSNSDILVSMDSVFIKRSDKDVRNFPGKVYYCIKKPEAHLPLPYATFIRYEPGEGMSDTPEYLRGLNSGFTALNVAYLLNARSISLLGFDMKMDGNKKHFHQEYEWTGGAGNYVAWSQRFGRAASQLKTKGIEVTNYVGPQGSSISCFPTRPLEELYD